MAGVFVIHLPTHPSRPAARNARCRPLASRPNKRNLAVDSPVTLPRPHPSSPLCTTVLVSSALPRARAAVDSRHANRARGGSLHPLLGLPRKAGHRDTRGRDAGDVPSPQLPLALDGVHLSRLPCGQIGALPTYIASFYSKRKKRIKRLQTFSSRFDLGCLSTLGSDP